jgi:hypothetical protein
MAKSSKSTKTGKPARPWNPRGYQGGPLPPGRIVPPKGPAADVPVKRKSAGK